MAAAGYDHARVNVRGTRRFSQSISEGDGISVLVEVRDADGARAAERQGAEGVVLREAFAGVREATELPILWCANGVDAARDAGADAYLLVLASYGDDWGRLADDAARAHELGLDSVLEARDDEELQLALGRLDPEIVLLSARSADRDADALDHVLELLPDVPAGKLAVAEVSLATRDDVLALERAGVDAVIVDARDVSLLVGEPAPDV